MAGIKGTLKTLLAKDTIKITTGWHGPLLTFLIGAFSEVMNWDVKINCGAEMKVYRRTPGSRGCGGKDFRCGAEMRGSVGRKGEQHLPPWLPGRKAGAQGGKQAGNKPPQAGERTD